MTAAVCLASVFIPGASFAGNSPPEPLQYVVPAGACWVDFTLGGAAGLGREVGGFLFAGGRGGYVTGRLDVVAGNALVATLGAEGAATAINTAGPQAAPGGGKSVITRNGTPVVVAGGGGGASYGLAQIVGSNYVETTIEGAPVSFQPWIYEVVTGPGGNGGGASPTLNATASNTAGPETVTANVTATAGVDPDLASLVQVSPAGDVESTIDVKLWGGGPGEGQPNGTPGGAEIRNQFGVYDEAAVAAAVTGGRGGSNWVDSLVVGSVTTGTNPINAGTASFTPVPCPPPDVDDDDDMPDTGGGGSSTVLTTVGFLAVGFGGAMLLLRRRRAPS